jgi:hypothetical protein
MNKSFDGFVVGSEFQVQYPLRGNKNILKTRRDGVIIGKGVSKNGGYVTVKYLCDKTGDLRVANFSIAKMINPIVVY